MMSIMCGIMLMFMTTFPTLMPADLGTIVRFSMSVIGEVTHGIQGVVVRLEVLFIGALFFTRRQRVVIFDCMQMVFDFVNGVFGVVFGAIAVSD